MIWGIGTAAQRTSSAADLTPRSGDRDVGWSTLLGRNWPDIKATDEAVLYPKNMAAHLVE